MDDTRNDDRPTAVDSDAEDRDRRSVWDRAFDGPPINPRSELIYHDRKELRSRHS